MDDVVDDRAGQHQARDPVPLDPRKPHPDDRQKRREEQGKHRGGHHPVEHAGHERVPLNFLRQVLVRGLERRGFSFASLAVRRENHVAGVRHQEHQAGKERGPQQAPRNVREDGLTPRIASPR